MFYYEVVPNMGESLAASSNELYAGAKVPSRGNGKHHDPETAECWVTNNVSKISTIIYCYAITLYCIIQEIFLLGGQMQKHFSWRWWHTWLKSLFSYISTVCNVAPTSISCLIKTIANGRSGTLGDRAGTAAKQELSLEEPDSPLMPRTLKPRGRADQISFFLWPVGTSEADLWSAFCRVWTVWQSLCHLSLSFILTFPLFPPSCLRYRCKQILHWRERDGKNDAVHQREEVPHEGLERECWQQGGENPHF